MSSQFFITTCALITSLAVLAGCDDAEKKAQQAEREKSKAREEATRRSSQNPAGNYTPVPIDMSMRPKTATPPPVADQPTPKSGVNP